MTSFESNRASHDPAPDKDSSPDPSQSQPSLRAPHSAWNVCLKDDPKGNPYDADAFKRDIENFAAKQGFTHEISRLEAFPAIGILSIECTPRIAYLIEQMPEVMSVAPERTCDTQDLLDD